MFVLYEDWPTTAFSCRRALPESRHRAAELFIRDVQVPLRLLDVGMPEHQLDRADVHSVAQEPAGAFMTKVVPVQIDLAQLGAIHASAGFCPLRVVTIRDEQERLPGRLEAGDVLAVVGAKHERVRSEFPVSAQDGREAAVRIERDAPVLLVLGCVARDPDCVSVPVDSLVLDEKHLAESAAQLERADDPVVHQWADVFVLPRVHGQRRIEEPLLLLA